MGVPVLEVLTPGPLTSVQDLGRYGYGPYGVAPSGALDGYALRVGNLLAGNPEGEAGLEVTLPGLKVKALTDVVLALTGADLGAQSDEKPLAPWRSYLLQEGETLSFKSLRSGLRAYLAVGGGIDVPLVLGSKSTNLSSRFGGFQGRFLKRGDILLSSPRRNLACAGRALLDELIPRYRTSWRLRVILGPREDDFTEEAFRNLLESSYEVTPQSDRTGVRLKGPPLRAKEGIEESIISEGVMAGNIQVPGDGQPIVLLNETVSGGYRKIASVISADLHLIAQMKPGDRVAFEEVSLDKAHEILKEEEKRLNLIRKAHPPP